ncbi:glutaminyl-tRNA synthetase / YqeY domain fusion protein [Campylobacter blaseri]|uniref:Glutamine--tRNA ligase n=1 Tax=Campylobacter blaseri TaxID=2042961 RepID=A0A2P8QYK2_9BACT|nr:glutamine--tRNA ligase/YqeY domain fusion protein [Campylobacter blaseri]PSM51312.1 glutamine--tRNA ligase [Campylobacter blaseri]PSM52456.1 glutamine--tRNA ligase [Campylobacter blaseri]QKF86213.1 glutaminyl-tRNA synthetase / YqeY domain fusion protein [Campylobacter blaseri]
MEKKTNFLENIIKDDLKTKKYEKIVTRFPPEPNGFPHIGHAKSICLNFGLAKEFNGLCNLRMDDTNPTTEETKYVKALEDAVKWLGFEYDGEIRYTSDYFPELYEYAIKLIKMGKAYVDSISEDEMSEFRGTVTSAGKRSKFAERTIEENLDLFERMKNGEFENGAHVLRAKIDMSSPNMQLRDPLLYRIRHASHFRTGDKWCIYPMYDFAHPLSDYLEGVTHSICTLEFENNRDIYNWLLDTLGLSPRPYQYEFARLNMNYTMMSKRKLIELVKSGVVSGWDDPRMPTIAGYKRKGYTKEAIVNFCEQIGVAKANSTVDVSQLEFCIRDDLNTKAPRVMCVLEPLKVVIENYEGSEELEADYFPPDVGKSGSRKLTFSKEIYIQKDDFNENPPKGYYRLTPTQSVRLKHGYIISFKEAIKDSAGNITEIRAIYHPNSKSGNDTSGIKVKSAIQWVSAKTAKKVEVRLYDRLFLSDSPKSMDDLNPNSLIVVKNALIEPAVVTEKISQRFQFERLGYFYADPVDYSDEHPVFNKIVGLKDSWTKIEELKQEKKVKKEHTQGEVKPLSKEEEKRFSRYTNELNLNSEIANTLARDETLSNFFEKALLELNSPSNLANIITSQVAKELKSYDVDELKFTPVQISSLVKMLDDELISSKIAKDVFEIMAQTGDEPEKIVKEKGLIQISDVNVIMPIIDEVFAKNSENLEKYKAGNTNLFGFFVGAVLKATGGKANPKVVNELVKKKLD